MIGPANLFWDSCVFIRYLIGEPSAYVDDIGRLIEDVQAGTRKIYCSSICYTEIRPSYLKKRGFGTIEQFFTDFGGSFEVVDPNPNILIAAGELRDSPSVHPNGGKTRVLGTPDAMHLETCLYVRHAMGVDDVVFQTLDEGKGSTWEGKCIPLLGLDQWFPMGSRTARVEAVCGLPRSKPLHPEMNLLSAPVIAAPSVSPH